MTELEIRLGVRIRRMTPEDYDQALALWVGCSGLRLRSAEDSRAGISAFLWRNAETCFVAETMGTVVGTILAGNDGRRGYLYHLAVDETCRRRGLGSELVRRATKALRRVGIRKTALVVLAENPEGNDFWEHIGFSARRDLVYRDRQLIS